MAKRQFLKNWSTQFPTQLQCSSIRINPQQLQTLNPPKQYKQPQDSSPRTPGINPHSRDFSSNEFVGFQNSIEIGGNNTNQQFLMKSKSMQYNKNKQIQASLLKSKEDRTVHLNSLYNTTSFDQMTMKISTNTRNNTSNYANQSQLTPEDHFYQKKLQKRQLVPFTDFYQQEDMVIRLSNSKNLSNQPPPTPPNNILHHLKSSFGDPSSLKNVKQDAFYQEPYFNKIPMQQSNALFEIKEEQSILRRQSYLYRINSQSNIKSMRSMKSVKSQGKMTLRDYLYLSKLTTTRSKSRIKGGGSKVSQLGQSPRRKKQLLSNNEMIDHLKNQLFSQIKRVQTSMLNSFDLVDSIANGTEVSVMKLFSLNRLFQDTLMKANSEIQSFLQQNN